MIKWYTSSQKSLARWIAAVLSGLLPDRAKEIKSSGLPTATRFLKWVTRSVVGMAWAGDEKYCSHAPERASPIKAEEPAPVSTMFKCFFVRRGCKKEES